MQVTSFHVTQLQEENMGRNHSRLAIWVWALTTSLFVIGGNAAYAWDNQARVHAAGQFLLTDPANALGGNSDRVTFGLEGKCPSPSGACAPGGISFTVPNTIPP